MKIGIVTIYKCYNYGSFYQAYGLQKYLQDLGHEAKFLPLDTLYNKKYRLRKQFNRNVSRDIFSAKLIGGYLKDWKLYHIADSKETDFDLIIIGSDEIWNINNRTFTQAPEYYGLNLPVSNVISYASCIGRSGADDFKEYGHFVKGIEGLRQVSARDDATEQFLKEIMPEKSILRVLDPSFLIDWSKVEKPCNKKDYILVYTYDGDWGFSKEYIEAAKKFSQEVQLPLISVGFKNDWCDESIACSPREFLGYLKNANYVITDTFHGTVMSIQYNKQFICMGAGKSKVESVLKELRLSDCIYSDQKDIREYVHYSIEYEGINAVIDQKRKESKEYLWKYVSN